MSGKVRQLSPQSVWDEEALLRAFDAANVRRSHHIRVISKLYKDFVSGAINHLSEFELPVNVPHAVAYILNSGAFTLMTSKVVTREDSKNGDTTKLLVELQDGQQVEGVLMRYNHPSGNGKQRVTLCVSSQVGCAMACSFCATGTMGLTGNLNCGEILEQFIWANQVDKIRNVVFMGMGEPLQNYDAVLSAIRAIVHSELFALRQDRVTLSTVGVVPRMLQLTDQAPYVALALSLHAPTQEMRVKIVPSAQQYEFDALMDAVDYYCTKTGRKMLMEYVMLDDVNCGQDTAHTLGRLLKGRNVMLNCIPFNPVLTKAQHRAPTTDTVDEFVKTVISYGVFTTVRREFGQDISGACGQLAVQTKEKRDKAMALAKPLEQEKYSRIKSSRIPGDTNTIKITPSNSTSESSHSNNSTNDIDGEHKSLSSTPTTPSISDEIDEATLEASAAVGAAEAMGMGIGLGQKSGSGGGCGDDIEDIAKKSVSALPSINGRSNETSNEEKAKNECGETDCCQNNSNGSNASTKGSDKSNGCCNTSSSQEETTTTSTGKTTNDINAVSSNTNGTADTNNSNNIKIKVISRRPPTSTAPVARPSPLRTSPIAAGDQAASSAAAYIPTDPSEIKARTRLAESFSILKLDRELTAKPPAKQRFTTLPKSTIHVETSKEKALAAVAAVLPIDLPKSSSSSTSSSSSSSTSSSKSSNTSSFDTPSSSSPSSPSPSGLIASYSALSPDSQSKVHQALFAAAACAFALVYRHWL